MVFKEDNIPWNKGKHYISSGTFKNGHKPTKEVIEKMKKSLKGRVVWNKGLTKEMDKRILRGNKCPSWKGGISKINHLIRTSFEYRLWIKYCMERDNYTCQDCKIIGGNLEVHHKKSLSKIIKENNIISMENARQCIEIWISDNGITYCDECHSKNDKFRRINSKG